MLRGLLLWSIVSARVLAGDATELNNRGVKLLRAGKVPEAISMLQRARRLAPGDLSVRKNLAYAHAQMGIDLLGKGAAQAAIPHLQTGLALHRDDHEFNFWLAVAYFRRHDYFAASVELRYLLQRQPRQARALEYLGHSLYRINRMSGAIKSWEKSLELAPINPALRNILAKARREQRVEWGFHHFNSGHFSVWCDARRGSEVASRALSMLEHAYERIGSRFGFHPTEKVTVILYTKRQFQAVTGAHGWVGGLYDGKIRLPVAGAPRSKLERVILHEYTHLVISAVAQSCPAWLNEGLAQRIEGLRGEWVRPPLAKAARSGRLLPLEALSAPFSGISEPARATLAYRQALSFVSFLVERYGERAVVGMVKEMGSGRRLEDSFRVRLRTAQSDAYQAWVRALSTGN